MNGVLNMAKENKEVQNMKPNTNPYLEKPETLDPTKKNDEYKFGGGGETNGSKK